MPLKQKGDSLMESDLFVIRKLEESGLEMAIGNRGFQIYCLTLRYEHLSFEEPHFQEGIPFIKLEEQSRY